MNFFPQNFSFVSIPQKLIIPSSFFHQTSFLCTSRKWTLNKSKVSLQKKKSSPNFHAINLIVFPYEKCFVELFRCSIQTKRGRLRRRKFERSWTPWVILMMIVSLMHCWQPKIQKVTHKPSPSSSITQNILCFLDLNGFTLLIISHMAYDPKLKEKCDE